MRSNLRVESPSVKRGGPEFLRTDDPPWRVLVPADRLDIRSLGLGKGRERPGVLRKSRPALNLGDLHLLLLMRLEAFARLDPHCWPSNQTLADMGGTKVEYVRDLIEDLESAGAITSVYTTATKRRRVGFLLHRRIDPDRPTIDRDNPFAMRAAEDVLKAARARPIAGRLSALESGAGPRQAVGPAPVTRVGPAPTELERSRKKDPLTDHPGQKTAENSHQTTTTRPKPEDAPIPETPPKMVVKAEEPRQPKAPIPEIVPEPEPTTGTPNVEGMILGQREFLAKLGGEGLRAAFDAQPENERIKMMEWFKHGHDPILWREATRRLGPRGAARPIPKDTDPLPALWEALARRDPEAVAPMTSRLVRAFGNDRKSFRGIMARVGEVVTGVREVESLIDAFRQAMGGKARNPGAVFMHALKVCDHQGSSPVGAQRDGRSHGGGRPLIRGVGCPSLRAGRASFRAATRGEPGGGTP